MAKRLIITCFLVFAAGAFEGSADVIQFHFDGSTFQDLGAWWEHDWTRKYEKDPDGSISLDESGNYIRKKIWIFPIPVFFLDGWHFLKLLLFLSYIASVAFTALYPFRSTNISAWWSFLLFMMILVSFRTAGFYLAWKLF